MVYVNYLTLPVILPLQLSRHLILLLGLQTKINQVNVHTDPYTHFLALLSILLSPIITAVASADWDVTCEETWRQWQFRECHASYLIAQ